MAAVALTAAAVTAGAAPSAAAATRPPGANLAHTAAPAVKPAASKPTVKCSKPGTTHSIQASVDLSDTHPSVQWNKSHPTTMAFDFKATPAVSLKLNFSGDVQCEADLTLDKIPLGESGLVLEIEPKLKFSASGEVGADFTWKPSVNAGFKVASGKFTGGPLSFSSDSGVDFTGSGNTKVELDLHAVIATVGGVAGVSGDITPTVTAKVSGSTASHTACWQGSEVTDAVFGTYIGAFGFTKKFDHKWQLGGTKTVSGCLDKTIVFDGSPATSAPPAKLGPYTMEPFAADEAAAGTVESALAGPTGSVGVSPALTHEQAGAGWATWSHGYEGDVYDDASVLPDGNIQVTVTLPPGTGAFYAYVEPDVFKDYAINATANNGVTSGNVTVNGDAGAKYFGFYATCGHTLKSVTFIDSGGDQAMAIGQLGVAKSC